MKVWAGAFQQNQLGLNKPHLPVAEARKRAQSGRNLPLVESPTVTHHYYLSSAVSHSVIHEKCFLTSCVAFKDIDEPRSNKCHWESRWINQPGGALAPQIPTHANITRPWLRGKTFESNALCYCSALVVLNKKDRRRNMLILFWLINHRMQNMLHVCTIQMLFCIFLILMWELSHLFGKISHLNPPPPPAEDGCVQFGINCPFKCREAVSVWRLQTDGTAARLYMMFPTASEEHYLPLERATVLEYKHI